MQNEKNNIEFNRISWSQKEENIISRESIAEMRIQIANTPTKEPRFQRGTFVTPNAQPKNQHMLMRKQQEKNAHKTEQLELTTKTYINKAAETGFKN